jgi:putative addiction module killer protein
MTFDIRQTPVFSRWMRGLRDERASGRISSRIRRLSLGLFGDVKSVGASVSELRIDHGPGYRLYFTVRNERIVILLCGGDKQTQDRDIRRAQAMVKELSDVHQDDAMGSG